MSQSEQANVWGGEAGEAWVRHADAYDATLAPFGEAVIDALGITSGQDVLDVGCGTGATSVHIATLTAPGAVVGADISAPMLAAARRRARAAGVDNVEFVELDLQAGSPGEARFDRAFSRFGVMFFTDPVAAFTNIRRSLHDAGRLGFICFQSPDANPFLVGPFSAAGAQLGVAPPPPGAPSPFSLADADRTREILEAAGFGAVSVTAGPDSATMHDATDLEALARRLIEQNPGTSAPFAAADDRTRQSALEATVAVLRPHLDGHTVVMDAATWVVTAEMPGAS